MNGMSNKYPAKNENNDELKDTLVTIVRNIPDKTLGNLFGKEGRRTVIVGKVLKLVLEIGVVAICNNRKKAS